jgi:hypothetical protein
VPEQARVDTPTGTATETMTPLAVAAADDTTDFGAGTTSENTGSFSDESPVAIDVSAETEDGGIPATAVVVVVSAVLLVLAYGATYVIQASNATRYREGFILSYCPVCELGRVYVDDRRYRVLGIPRVRRVVRCDYCRSVLRQVRPGRWRYAIDRIANPYWYDEFNGQVVSEDWLVENSPEFREGRPEYIEDDLA